jgi:two-component system, NtrC family, sensor histidine kinase HydH
MKRTAVQISIVVQVAAVFLLFVGSVTMLWRSGSSVFQRERIREKSERELAEADDALASRGAPGLVAIPDWPETLDLQDWDTLDRWLSMRARDVFSTLPDAEGGYYIPVSDRYLGYGSSAAVRQSTGKNGTRRHSSDPPPRVFDLVDSQIRESIEHDRPLLSRIDVPPDQLVLRSAPVWVNGRKVASTWTLARVSERRSLQSSIQQYQVAVGMALGALVLALLLSVGLAWTVRRQATERARLRNELRRNERLAALGKLLAGVAHEVRNPLAGIRSSAQLWQRGVLSPEDDVASGLLAEVDRLESIVSRLLQFSRADSLEMEPGIVNALVAEAAQLAKGQATDQGVIIDLNLASDLPAVAMSAPAMLQVLRNLTTNALQAMPDGGTLLLTTRTTSVRRRVEVTVADTGPGLSSEVRDHLFDPFFTTKSDGTGLGLAIAREIILAHRGEIRVEPPGSNSGATFVLSLPTLTKRARRLDFSPSNAVG